MSKRFIFKNAREMLHDFYYSFIRETEKDDGLLLEDDEFDDDYLSYLNPDSDHPYQDFF
jgi:hypothetical protein